MSGKLLATASILLLSVAFSPLQAQQPAAESTTTKPPETPAKPQQDEKKAEPGTAQTEITDFRPTENISEDFSVAFPVDI